MTTEVKVPENERDAELAMKKAKWAQNSQVTEVGAKKVLALGETKVSYAFYFYHYLILLHKLNQ